MPYIDMEEVRRIVEDQVRSEFRMQHPLAILDRIEITSMNMRGVADKRVCNVQGYAVHNYIESYNVVSERIDFYAQVNVYTASIKRFRM